MLAVGCEVRNTNIESQAGSAATGPLRYLWNVLVGTYIILNYSPSTDLVASTWKSIEGCLISYDLRNRSSLSGWTGASFGAF